MQINMELSGRPRRECNDDDELARVRLMSSKKKAAERKKQKRLDKERSYDKKRREKKKRKTKENRTKVKDENAQHSLPEAVVSSNGMSLPECNILEDVMADRDHEMLCCDVKGEDDSAGLKSMTVTAASRSITRVWTRQPHSAAYYLRTLQDLCVWSIQMVRCPSIMHV